MERKRIRSANFTPQEKFLCLNLISKFRETLESKTAKRREKDEAWLSIESEFNSITPAGIKRTKECLKKFYENRKKKRRRAVKARYMSEKRGDSINHAIIDHSYDITSDLRLSPIISLKSEFEEDQIGNTLPGEIISRLSPETIEINSKDNLIQNDNTLHLEGKQVKSETNILSSQHYTEYSPETSQERIRNEDNLTNRRCRTTIITKHEELASVKLKCSQVQLNILRIEEEHALLRLTKEKDECERRNEENERQKEEYERRKIEHEEKRKREEELFLLKRESILLDIEIKKKQLLKTE